MYTFSTLLEQSKIPKLATTNRCSNKGFFLHILDGKAQVLHDYCIFKRTTFKQSAWKISKYTSRLVVTVNTSSTFYEQLNIPQNATTNSCSNTGYHFLYGKLLVLLEYCIIKRTTLKPSAWNMNKCTSRLVVTVYTFSTLHEQRNIPRLATTNSRSNIVFTYLK